LDPFLENAIVAYRQEYNQEELDRFVALKLTLIPVHGGSMNRWVIGA
jgi:hypothetical protein